MKKTGLHHRLLLTGLLCLLLPSCVAKIPTETLPPETAVQTPEVGKSEPVICGDFLDYVPAGTHEVSVCYINAGKADSILVQVDGKNYLIDTGTAASVPVIDAALEQCGVTALDGIFLTHTDNDHVGGMRLLTEAYPPKSCYTSVISMEWTTFESVIGDLPWTVLDPGAVVEIGDGVAFQVLGPIRYNPIDDNDNSLVLRLEVNGRVFLFCGDMKHDEEKSLLHNGMPLDCDILKVGYHGRKDATSVSFLDATTPSYAIISTDRDEDDKSAHKSIVKALEERNTALYITDESTLGYVVTVTADGEISVSDLESAASDADVRFTTVSKAEQITVIENREGADVDLSGWYIVSMTGKEVFRFPDGTILAEGGTLTVACAGGEGDYIWADSRVWNKSKDDRAVLYDTHGNHIDEKDSE